MKVPVYGFNAEIYLGDSQVHRLRVECFSCLVTQVRQKQDALLRKLIDYPQAADIVSMECGSNLVEVDCFDDMTNVEKVIEKAMKEGYDRVGLLRHDGDEALAHNAPSLNALMVYRERMDWA